MKKLLLLVPLIFIVVLAVVFGWWSNISAPASTSVKPVDFLITKGSSAGVIGNNLQSKGIIKSSLAFKLYLLSTGQAAKIPTGEFQLYPNKNLAAVIADLLKGPREVWVTIPEGLRREEIAVRLANGLGLTGEPYRAFTAEFLNLSKDKEGYLFPETYLFPKDVVPALVFTKMLETYTQKVGTKITQKQLILASLIERETKGDAEKPIVAGIILNRLNAGWPLQIDATVQYAKNNSAAYWGEISKSDLALKSPFNTYLYQGLPPAPICNPGLASIRAAENPQLTDFWFYLHDSEGQIHYGKTAEEHAANVRKYLGK